ncbi:MAG: hypothetical protein OXF88_25030 [Rhodobacteraceae bacterium]|nr:hypothetical protein [Paracoccaceae bacterium]MCY4141388.1 hypothetical protein [Paracoccaceae bacterium]
MINGICLVKQKDRVRTSVYHKLNTLLNNHEEHGWGVFYTEDQDLNNFDNVIFEVAELTGLHIYWIRTGDVEIAFNDEQFLQCNGQVAVCDIGDGAHSILLTDRNGDWFSGFDPWWYGPGRCGNDRLRFPRGDDVVNVEIRKDHLLEEVTTGLFEVGKAYQMGTEIKYRFLTVIENH